MPIRQYKCKCGNSFEVIYKTFSDDAKRERTHKCSKCNKMAEEEEFSIPAKFPGTYGKENNWSTAPSKRFSYKKSMPGEEGNKGSA